MTKRQDVADLTFEQALAELQNIVQKLEEGGLSLEESLALFERGRSLADYCNAQLDQADLRIKYLTSEGEAPFEL